MYYMKILTRILFFSVLSFLFFSCASMGSGFYEETGLTVTDQLNQGMHESLSDESVYPFVFETEILASDSQIKMLWEGLSGAGYVLDNPEVVLNRVVTVEDSSLFADSWEIKSFFEKYLEDSDRLLQVNGSDRGCYFLLRKQDKNEFEILGWKEVSK